MAPLPSRNSPTLNPDTCSKSWTRYRIVSTAKRLWNDARREKERERDRNGDEEEDGWRGKRGIRGEKTWFSERGRRRVSRRTIIICTPVIFHVRRPWIMAVAVDANDLGLITTVCPPARVSHCRWNDGGLFFSSPRCLLLLEVILRSRAGSRVGSFAYWSGSGRIRFSVVYLIMQKFDSSLMIPLVFLSYIRERTILTSEIGFLQTEGNFDSPSQLQLYVRIKFCISVRIGSYELIQLVVEDDETRGRWLRDLFTSRRNKEEERRKKKNRREIRR